MDPYQQAVEALEAMEARFAAKRTYYLILADIKQDTFTLYTDSGRTDDSKKLFEEASAVLDAYYFYIFQPAQDELANMHREFTEDFGDRSETN
jgi:hypothetical protein